MTTTLTYTVSLKRDDTLTTTGRTVELTIGDFRQAGTISVGTSESTITIDTTIDDAGLCYVRNHADPDDDPTVYVDIGFSTGVYVCRLFAGESGVIPLLTTASAIYVIASDAATKFQYEITERSIPT